MLHYINVIFNAGITIRCYFTSIIWGGGGRIWRIFIWSRYQLINVSTLTCCTLVSGMIDFCKMNWCNVAIWFSGFKLVKIFWESVVSIRGQKADIYKSRSGSKVICVRKNISQRRKQHDQHRNTNKRSEAPERWLGSTFYKIWVINWTDILILWLCQNTTL